MARATQSQGTPRWNPYSIGEMRKLLKDELDKLSSNDTYRNTKVGTSSYKDAKGRTNWNIYLYGELFEKFTKRFDDTIHGTYSNTIQTMNNNTAVLNNLAQQLRVLEGNINKYLKASFENVLTNVVRNSGQIEELKNEFGKKNAELIKVGEANKSDIRKATKILKDSFTAEITSMRSGVSTNHEDLNEKLSEMSGNMENIKSGTTSLTDLINEKIQTHQETMNNVLEDQQKLTVSELTENMKESASRGREHFEQQAEKLAQRMDNVQNNIEDKINEVTETYTQKIEENTQNFNREMTEMRQIISTLRADIEVMKSLLASLAK